MKLGYNKQELCRAAIKFDSYSARMSPETTHKLMGFYVEVLILDIIL